MSDFSNAITDAQRAFIEQQTAFVVAGINGPNAPELLTAPSNRLRLLGPNLLAYFDLGAPDLAVPALLAGSGRKTMLFSAPDAPSILRLHGETQILPSDAGEWELITNAFGAATPPERVILFVIDRVEELPAPHLAAPPAPAAASVQIDPDWTSAVLNYWLNTVGPESWFDSSDEEDARCLHLFRSLWDVQRHKPATAFLEDADMALAALVLFDQFPRNMFRGDARAFSTDALAVEIAKLALEKGYDQEFVEGARPFFYMPFMHSEDLADQERSLDLFSQPGLENNMRFAVMHHAIIARFGRFPHRNAVLGRETLPEEEEAVEEGSGW